MTSAERAIAGALVALLSTLAVGPERVLGYDPNETFRKGAYVLSVEGGGGQQHDVASHPDETGLKFLNGGVRLALLPFGPTLRPPAMLTEARRGGAELLSAS